jgi:hypothetical protein
MSEASMSKEDADHVFGVCAAFGAWRSIDSAPKDGTSVLLACNYDRLGKQRITLAWYERGMWAEGMYWDDDADDWSVAQCEFRPTHWMPLPEPPSL